MFLFFFSSRRRHTRYIGDWSSDVCSSDLTSVRAFENSFHGRTFGALSVTSNEHRSEERRVGNECSRRRAPRRQKNRAGRQGGAARSLLALSAGGDHRAVPTGGTTPRRSRR